MEGGEDELNFAIMCTGTSFQDYAAVAIKQLLDHSDISLEALIIHDRETKEKVDSSGIRRKLGTLKEVNENRSWSETINYVTWLYQKKLFGVPECNQSTNLASELDGVSRIKCSTRTEGYSQYFFEEDLAQIKELDLDFILRRAFGILRGDILNVPAYGVWSFHGDDERKYRGGPPGFWEIYKDDPVTGAILQRLTERLDAGIVLRRGFFPTIPDHRANMNQIKYGSAKWPRQVAVDILNGEAEYINGEPSTSDAKIYKKPSPHQLFRYYLKKAKSKTKILTRGVPYWNVGVIKSEVENVSDENIVHWFPKTQRNSFIADPFACKINSQEYVFFEDYSYETEKGHISYVEYDDGFIPPRKTALKEAIHLSYPYIFTCDDTVYATPDTQEANEIRLYTLDEPDEWELQTTIVSDVRGADPTVVNYDNYWWLFYTKDGKYSSSLTDLEIWYAPHPEGPWQPHANNPVKTDVRSARSGGTPFVNSGILYRPAQDCASGYGTKVVVNQVNELSPTTFAEERITDVEPGSADCYPDGRHTLSSAGSVTLIDGKRVVRNKYAFNKRLAQLQSKIK